MEPRLNWQMGSMTRFVPKYNSSQATAFAPAHISGFFQPFIDPDDDLRSGSSGAGLCVSKGCISTIQIKESSKQSMHIRVNGQRSDLSIVNHCLSLLLEQALLQITVDIEVELPWSQGFGMSGAGCLSAAYALCECLGLPKIQALHAAHRTEVQFRTGLGDVMASYHGGVELRIKPGVLSQGYIRKIPGDIDLVLCITGDPMNTKDVLTNEEQMDIIQTSGKTCIDALVAQPGIDRFFDLSWKFTQETGLATQKILDAVTAVRQVGQASMCMLGNAVFATGEPKKVSDALKPYGPIIHLTTESKGARLLTEFTS